MVNGGYVFAYPNKRLLLSTQDELVESKNRSRTLELRAFSCPDLMHEFEFEVRNPDQIRTVKMAVTRHLKYFSNILRIRSGNGTCQDSCPQ
jgi:hypothetical protein